MGNSTLADLSGLKRRLAAVFAAVAAALIASGFLYHRHYQSSLRSEASKMLLSIEQIKLHQLQLWREDRANSALSLLDGWLINKSLRVLAVSPENKEAAAALRGRLQSYIKRSNYQYAAIAGIDGKVLLHTGGRPEKMCPQITSLIGKAKASGSPELGDFYLLPGETSPHIDIVTPAARGQRGRELFLLLRLDPADFLYPLLQAWSARGSTGEILLVARDGDDLLFLNDLRHVRDAAMRLRRPLSMEQLPAAMGLRGKTGIVEGVDYRGVQVLAAVGPVPDTNWAIVTKMDRAEVLKGAGALAVLLVLLVLSLLGVVAAAVFFVFRVQAEEHRKDSEQSKEELKEKVRELAEAQRLAHIGNWTLDLATNKLYWSDEIFRIFELDKEKFGVSYEAFLNAIHPEDRDAVHKAYTDSIESKAAYSITHRLLLKDGKVKHVNEFCETFYGKDGRALRSVGTVQDVTSIRETERELDRRNSMLNSLLDSLSGGVFMVEVPSGKPLFANRSAERLLGRGVLPAASKENISKVYSALRVPGRTPYPPGEMPILRGMRGEISRVEDMLVVRPDGTETLLEVYGTPVRDSLGNIWASLVNFQDITERKLAEEKILKLNQSLAAKNKEMENFLYITTHDLRSPLVNIQGFSQNLQRDLAEIRAALAEAALPEERKARAQKLSEEKVPEALGFVLESSSKMEMLLSALLKVSRLGRQELKPEPLEMGAMLGRIVDAMIFQVREAGAEVKIGPLPPCLADAASVSQLFSNLLDNAVKYRDAGRKMVIEISGETRGGRAVYRVADNGPGIPAADLERLWDVFYRPARAGMKSGEGIGLPMCKRIAERNGGDIRVETTLGGGSAFVVELPAAQGTEGA